ncbi:hypothetical protein NHQ30_002057 [Ciborinia camelliae]|nr:hypothetical protein NHQ30_002057 [Ciborinia camelliae]
MELDDGWNPDPLPNGNPRNQSPPRLKRQAARHSRGQSQYYNSPQSSRPHETDRNAGMNYYDDISDEDSSTNEYPVVFRQPQINQKRVGDPAQVAPERRKRHQSEHPSSSGRGRTTNTEAMSNHNQVILQTRNKSMARSEIKYQATEDEIFNGYQAAGNAIPVSRKSVARSLSRARDPSQDQGHMAMENYNEEFSRKPSFIVSQSNAQANMRMKEGPVYNSVPNFSHGPSIQGRQASSRTNHEQLATPERQRSDFSRAQSAAPSVMSSTRSQRQRQNLQLGPPLWPNHDSAIQKPPTIRRLQGDVEKPSPRNSASHTPRNQSARRSVGPNGTQLLASQSKTYDYGSIDDNDVNDTPLEYELQRRSNSQVQLDNRPMDFINALPRHSAFQSRNSQTTNQSYQTPPINSNRSTTSGVIDLVTPESGASARASMPYVPPNWTPRTRPPTTTGRIKVSTPLKHSMQDIPSANGVQQPVEDIRQRQAAEKIVRQELNAEREALQKDLFGEVVSETEEEKREREEAKRLEAQRVREEKDKQLAIEAEAKRRKAEVKAQKEREKKAAEQLEKEKEAAARKAKRDAERHHQSLREEQAAAERRKAANDLLQQKKERETALLKAIDEQKQIAEKERKEQAAKIDQMSRSVQQLTAQIKAQTIAGLKPARKSTADSGTTKTAEAPAPPSTLPTNMEIDDEDSLFLPETENVTATNSTDQQISKETQCKKNSSDNSLNTAQVVVQCRAPASAAEIFANTIPNHGGEKVPEDREAEREAIRKKRADERAAAQRKRATSVPVEPSPKPPSRTRATSKAPSKAPPKKNAAHSTTKSPGNSVFGTKLKPLHGPDYSVQQQMEKSKTIAEEPHAKPPALQPRPPPLPLPPLPPPPPTSATTTSKKPETRLISQAERDEIESNRERIQAEAKARKDVLNKQRADAKKEELEQKRTVEYRKKKEKQLREEACRNGKELSDLELETTLKKLMEKREGVKKRRNQRRTEEKAPSSEGGQQQPIPNPSLPNDFSMTSAQVSSSDTASDSNHMDEDDDPETRARKEHEAKTAVSLKELAQSRASQRGQVSPVEKMGPLFSDDSEESEEDPDDDETMEAMMAHARKNNAAKAAEKVNEVQPEAQTEEELALERDLEAALEGELTIEGEPESEPAPLNPDDYDAQIVEPMPDMTSSFQGSSTQEQSNTVGNLSTQLTKPSERNQPAPAKPQSPASYAMVNVYMVMTQLTFHGHEDEEALKKKFCDLDKANKYAQTLVNEHRAKKFMQQEIVEKWDKDYKYSCQITHDKDKKTKVFVKAVPMDPKEIDKYDPRDVRPRFANKYYTVRFEKIVEQLDPETQEVRMTTRTVGFADASKLYTVLEMANHAAAEYLLNEIKPKQEVEEYRTLYEEQLLPPVRTLRDTCIKSDEMFGCEVEGDSCTWADFKSLDVSVEMSITEGPIN